MSELFANRLARYRNGGFRSCALLLIALVVGCYLLLAPVAIWWEGYFGLVKLAVAALACCIPGVVALATTAFWSVRRHALVGLLVAMAVRMIPPLVICMVIALRGTGVEYLNFVVYLLTFYLVTLAAETFLAVQQVANHTSRI